MSMRLVELCGVFAVCLVPNVVLAESQVVSPDDVAVLQDAAKRYEANVEAIRTWQGEVVYEELGKSSEKTIPINRKTSIRFWVDVPNGKRMIICEPVEETQMSSDGEFHPVVMELKSTLVLTRDSLRYHRTAYDPKGYIPLPDNNGGTRFVRGEDSEQYDLNVLRGSIHISTETKPAHNQFDLIHTFDPFVVMDHVNTHYIQIFNFVVERINNGKDVSMFQINVRGEQLSLIEESTRGNRTISNIYTVNKSFRCCPVERRSSVPGILNTVFTSEYEQHDGVYVPKKVLILLEDGASKRIVTFTKNVINEPIPDDIFSLRGLGAMRGDSVYDSRTNTRYYLDDEQYPLPDYAKEVKRNGSNVFRYTLMAISLILIGIALLRIYFRWRSSV